MGMQTVCERQEVLVFINVVYVFTDVCAQYSDLGVGVRCVYV
jgi:hypothetical protein